MAKNLLHPYKYQIKSEDTYYLFTTENGIEYAVFFETEIQAYFANEYPEKAEQFVEFGFMPINIKLAEVSLYSPDERIILTVVQILKDYFEQNQNAIIYNCLAFDGKQNARARYFEIIFQKVKQNEILKFDTIIDAEKAIQYHQSLLIRKDNPNLEDLVEAFYSISYLLSS